MDNPFVFCPYDKTHRVPRSRIQYHIVRCKSSKPDYVICPYNATHRYPESQIKEHILICPTKEANFPVKFNVKTFELKPEDTKVKIRVIEEDIWDD